MRLIDADRLKAVFDKNIGNPYAKGVFRQYVDMQPTISQWIPVKFRPVTEEERMENEWDEEISHIADFHTPDDGEEVLVTLAGGRYVELIEFCNGDYGIGDDRGNDWLYDVDAWMPLPEPYKEVEDE